MLGRRPILEDVRGCGLLDCDLLLMWFVGIYY